MKNGLKPVFKTVKVKRAHCPKDNTMLEKVTDPDARTIMTYRCPKCFWCY